MDHELMLLALPDVPQLAGDFANYAVIATLSAGLLTFLLRHRDRRIGRLYLGMRRRERLVVVHPAMLPRSSLQMESGGVADALAQGEVQAVKYITDFFAARLKHPRLTLRFPPAHVDVDGLLILLGGPRWNASTSQVLAGLRAFEVNEETRTIRVPVLPELAEPSTEYDRALILVGPNPFRDSGRFVLCCGLTTNSTEAMTRYLFESIFPMPPAISWKDSPTCGGQCDQGTSAGNAPPGGRSTVRSPSADRRTDISRSCEPHSTGELVANVNVSADGTAAVITDSVTAYSYSYDRVPSYQLLEVRHRDRSRTMTPKDGVYTFSMTTNEKITLDITLRNNGDGSWQSDETFPIRLGTAVPNDRFSHFSTPEWTLPHRPADLGARIVVPGAVVTLPVTLRAPPAAGRHREAFQLIHELRTWCHGPVIRLDVTVEPTHVAPAR